MMYNEDGNEYGLWSMTWTLIQSDLIWSHGQKDSPDIDRPAALPFLPVAHLAHEEYYLDKQAHSKLFLLIRRS